MHVCRSGSRVGADGRIWVAVLDEERERRAHVCREGRGMCVHVYRGGG